MIKLFVLAFLTVTPYKSFQFDSLKAACKAQAERSGEQNEIFEVTLSDHPMVKKLKECRWVEAHYEADEDSGSIVTFATGTWPNQLMFGSTVYHFTPN